MYWYYLLKANCWFTIVLNDGKYALNSMLILVHKLAASRPSGLLFIWTLKYSVCTVVNKQKMWKISKHSSGWKHNCFKELLIYFINKSSFYFIFLNITDLELLKWPAYYHIGNNVSEEEMVYINWYGNASLWGAR